jgi:succinate dehydrogenase / fumarate reductase iron-sulfur subunit
MQVSVYRYNPDLDEVPVMRDVSVDLPEGKDLMVLDVLQLIKDEDPTLSFRRSCREGVCGSDGINMNGKNGLACITPVSEVAKRNKLVLRPLPGLPVVRDLVVDMSQFYKQYSKVQPYLVNNEAPPSQERLQSTGCTNVFCALVVRLHVRLFGGTLINLLAQLDCFKRIAFLPIREILTQSSVWPT